jgi:hypothetical protein
MEIVNLERVRVVRLSGELAQRELMLHRAQRAIIAVVQSRYRKCSNYRLRTTSPGGVRRETKGQDR